MVEFYLFVIIALAFVVYVTVEFVKSLGKKGGNTKGKIWEWIKNVIDIISCIG
jgi:hypothetical protein